MAVNLETTTHIVGPYVRIGNRVIQRCLICGEKLWDVRGPLAECCWTEGALLVVSEHEMRQRGDFLSMRGLTQLPDDFCIDLVEM